MYKTTQPLFLFCETPLHAGSGSDLGIIDMPIQRERHTGYPKIESSSLKGSLREAFERKNGIDQAKIHRIFGFDSDSANKSLTDAGGFFADKKDREFSGCLAVTDARILLFPVKTQKGVFAWITCPRVASRFISEMKEYCKVPDNELVTLSENKTGEGSKIIDTNEKVGLEEYIFDGIKPNADVTKFGKWIASKLFSDVANNYWATKMAADIVVISDDDFADFVQYSTEVITRTKIDNETGTVSDTALFTEEYLPAESVMYSLAMFAPEFKKNGMGQAEVQKFYQDNLPEIFQIGGNATLGKGIVRTKPKAK
jgi:CRISPR-associated protein Cmr4